MGIVITVSRQLGSGGSYIATAVAEAMGYRYFDREILQRAAHAAGYPDDEMVEELTRRERVPGFLDRIVESFGRMSPVPVIPSATMREGQAYAELLDPMLTAAAIESQRRYHAAEGYRELVRDVIETLADTGDVVIAGRGGQVILRDHPTAIHIRVIASVPTRVRNLVARQELTEKAAQTQIQESDRERARYLKRYHGVDVDDPLLYHLVINTDAVPVALGEHLIVETARWLSSVTPPRE